VRRMKLGSTLASLLVGAWTALCACSGPFFPVPPPAEVTFSSQTLTDGTGAPRTLWKATRGPDPLAASAHFFLQDVTQRTGVDSFAETDGSYVSPLFEGQPGDRIDLYFQRSNGDESQSACLVLQEGNAPRCP